MAEINDKLEQQKAQAKELTEEELSNATGGKQGRNNNGHLNPFNPLPETSDSYSESMKPEIYVQVQ